MYDGKKVFIIGLSKTGKSSLVSALAVLRRRLLKFPRDLSLIAGFDGAYDTPVADQFEILDTLYNNARFILTVRDKEAWLTSCAAMWLRQQQFFDGDGYISNLHSRLYGTTRFNRVLFSTAYDRHRERVFEHFQNRNRDLLLLDIGQADPWKALCSFLDEREPQVSFPMVRTEANLDNLVRHILHKTNDAGYTAEITGLGIAYVSSLHEIRGSNHFLEPEIIHSNANWEIRHLISRLEKVFGSYREAATHLDLPQ